MGLNFATAVNGMRTDQQRINIASNNLSNIQTTGFKEQLTTHIDGAGGNNYTPTLKTNVNASPGPKQSTDRSLDVTAPKDSFIPVQTDQGVGYVTSDSFNVDGQGNLVQQATGNPVLGQNGPIQTGTTEPSDVSIKSNGQVISETSEGTTVVGQIELARFQNPGGLRRGRNGNLFQTANTGQPNFAQPKSQNRKPLQSGILEQSNIQFEQETIDLQQIQRSYQMNARHFSVRNQMLRLVASLAG
ncbi:MAG: flagellar hook-basal body protein [bacterium]